MLPLLSTKKATLLWADIAIPPNPHFHEAYRLESGSSAHAWHFPHFCLAIQPYSVLVSRAIEFIPRCINAFLSAAQSETKESSASQRFPENRNKSGSAQWAEGALTSCSVQCKQIAAVSKSFCAEHPWHWNNLRTASSRLAAFVSQTTHRNEVVSVYSSSIYHFNGNPKN